MEALSIFLALMPSQWSKSYGTVDEMSAQLCLSPHRAPRQMKSIGMGVAKKRYPLAERAPCGDPCATVLNGRYFLRE